MKPSKERVKTNWKKQFKDEFGKHFSKSEYQFVIEFIEELLEAQAKEIGNIDTEFVGWNSGSQYDNGYKDGFHQALREVKAKLLTKSKE